MLLPATGANLWMQGVYTSCDNSKVPLWPASCYSLYYSFQTLDEARANSTSITSSLFENLLTLFSAWSLSEFWAC